MGGDGKEFDYEQYTAPIDAALQAAFPEMIKATVTTTSNQLASIVVH